MRLVLLEGFSDENEQCFWFLSLWFTWTGVNQHVFCSGIKTNPFKSKRGKSIFTVHLYFRAEEEEVDAITARWNACFICHDQCLELMLFHKMLLEQKKKSRQCVAPSMKTPINRRLCEVIPSFSPSCLENCLSDWILYNSCNVFSE